jgi:teichuronic acid biosynthesis glycosyltransferase TuaC
MTFERFHGRSRFEPGDVGGEGQPGALAPDSERGAIDRNVLTLSHLYPSPASPGSGPFVRDEVIELAKRNRMAVIAPMGWTPFSIRKSRRLRRVPVLSTEDGVQILRPRLPTVPLGGLVVESHIWASRLEPLLRRIHGEIGADLVHAHFALPDGFAAARYASGARVPLVLTVWGSDVMLFAQKRSLRGLLRRTFAAARAIIAVSEELASRSEELGARSERLSVIPGGVPYRPAIPRDEARAHLGVEAAVCLLWIGGLVEVKQPLHALEAFEQLDPAQTRNMLLVMIGDGPLRHDVTNHVRRRNLERRVRLIGHRDREEVWMWQCAADLLVNSSRSEGTPIALLETLGAGTPAAGYPVGGIGAVLDAVDGGAIAAGKTPHALAEAINEALAAGRAREQLAQHAQARFHIAETARAIENVYDAVL